MTALQLATPTFSPTPLLLASYSFSNAFSRVNNVQLDTKKAGE
jgi:hypothetical protein